MIHIESNGVIIGDGTHGGLESSSSKISQTIILLTMTSWQKLIDVYYSARTVGNVRGFPCFHLWHEFCLLGMLKVSSHLISGRIKGICNALAETCIGNIHRGILIFKNIKCISVCDSFNGSILRNWVSLWIAKLKVLWYCMLSFLCICIFACSCPSSQVAATQSLSTKELLVDRFIHAWCLQKLAFSNMCLHDGFDGASMSLSYSRMLVQAEMVIFEHFGSWGISARSYMLGQRTLTYFTLRQILS